jgi:hypothetical protein
MFYYGISQNFLDFPILFWIFSELSGFFQNYLDFFHIFLEFFQNCLDVSRIVCIISRIFWILSEFSGFFPELSGTFWTFPRLLYRFLSTLKFLIKVCWFCNDGSKKQTFAMFCKRTGKFIVYAS